MPSEWTTFTVDELARGQTLSIGDGYRAKNAELGSEGPPFARAGNINIGFDFSTADRVPPETIARVGEKRSRVGDVVFTSKGTVGRFAFVNEETEPFVFSPQLCYWRSLDPEAIDARYLYFWFHGTECQHQLDLLKGQTDMADYVSLRDQRTMAVTLPPPREQQAIASVLGALDDKIEGNRRLASRLHDFALSHFRHLFGARIEGPTSLTDVTDVTGGRSYKSSELAPSSTALVSLKSIAPGGGYQSGGLKSFTGSFKKQQVVQPGEIIVAMTDLTQAANVVGRAARVPNQDHFESVVASLDLAVLRPRPPISNAYLYGLLHSRAWQQQAFGYANGSTVLHLSKKAFPEFLIDVPTASEIQRLDALCDPLYATAGAAEAEADTLTAIRDALLPRLVSGKIRVPLSDDPVEQVGVDVEELSA